MNKVLIITNNYKGFVEQVFLDNISSTTFKFAHTIETILKPYQNKKSIRVEFYTQKYSQHEECTSKVS